MRTAKVNVMAKLAAHRDSTPDPENIANRVCQPLLINLEPHGCQNIDIMNLLAGLEIGFGAE